MNEQRVKAMALRRAREDALESGKCIKCFDEDAIDGAKVCVDCRREGLRKREMKMSARVITSCVRCGEPFAATSKRLCQKHLEMSRRDTLKYQAKKRAAAGIGAKPAQPSRVEQAAPYRITIVPKSYMFAGLGVLVALLMVVAAMVGMGK